MLIVGQRSSTRHHSSVNTVVAGTTASRLRQRQFIQLFADEGLRVYGEKRRDHLISSL